MFLGTYRFDGDPDALVAAYDRLAPAIPLDGSAVHVCVRRPDGITISGEDVDAARVRGNPI